MITPMRLTKCARPPSSVWFTVLTCGATLFTDTYLYALAVPVLPYTLANRAHVPEADVQTWVSILLAVHGAAIAIGSPICAWWADRGGGTSRQLPYFAGMLGLVGATILLYFAQSIPVLIAGRVLQGLSGAVAWTIPPAIVTDRVGIQRVGPYLGYMALGRSAGMAAGPLVGGALFAYRGYRMVYGTAFILIAGDIVLRMLLVLEPRAPADLPPSSHSRLPASLHLLRTARMWTAIWGSFHSAFLCGGMDAVLPLFVWRAYGWNSIQAGAAFLALVGPSVLSPLVGWLTQKFGPRWCATVGYGATGIMVGLLAIITRDGGSHQALMVTLLLFTGTFALLSEIASWVDAATVADLQSRHCPSKFARGGVIASVYALTNIMFALGFVAGPLATGFTFAQLGWEAVSLLLAIVTLVGTIPSLIWTERPLSFAEDTYLADVKLNFEE